MAYLANVVGILAVVLFVLSYQIKERKPLIIMNASSRVLYVAQYLLLGAFEGALLDTVALLVSVLCHSRDRGLIKKHLFLVMVASNLLIIGVGLTTYKNTFSLLPILGVIFETMALWLKREKHIRLCSLAGAPPWLVYNLYSHAYGSSIGNVITLVSLFVAILRYDVFKKEKRKEQPPRNPD